jgi:hypothetical protein
MAEITAQNFHHELQAFVRRDGGDTSTPSKSFIMIRPDRPEDHFAHKYQNDAERYRGNSAKRAWFEYLDAKGLGKTLAAYRAMLKSGQSIMVVCADPAEFDAEFVVAQTKL